MSDAIRVRDLRKTYPSKPPVEAVRGIDLRVERGECFGLLGPNGAGKTTTIEILEGLLDATSGDVEILGMRWDRDGDAIRQRIGISLQETRLSEKLTLRETLRLFRSFYRQGRDPDELIDQLSLGEKADARVGKLSGGQKQRLAVACALVGDPELLFLDEPTTGLDPRSRRELWAVIQQFRDSRRTVLLTTHYLEEAERLCDRVAIVDRGRVIACDTPRGLIASLGGEHVVEFQWNVAATGSVTGSATGTATGSATGSKTATAGPRPPLEALLALPSVTGARDDGERIALSVTEPHLAVPALLARLPSLGFQLAGLTTRHASLEDVFIKVAGHALNDAEPPIRE
ncbi:MAG: ABC transporter ATP-binding protein [Planctomycetota bacterium]